MHRRKISDRGVEGVRSDRRPVEERVLRNSSHHKLCAGFDYECGALFEVT
ncbi:hypothetical protein B7P43_G02169 [Cryptotermes secundus]|uniref:Uncharacterized protein n=1 Tax=Cryptotermes secundus TaxID=105785 RepID=A0A2J7Q2N8_9NEOP|nr:hypothetical protein B7P43_G02169 [Cryptotermes secundus]